MHKILALDIGGTKLATSLVDEQGQLSNRIQVPTNVGNGTPHFLYEQVLDLLERGMALSPNSPTAIGIGCGGPGKQAYELVSPLNIPNWKDFPLRKKIETDLQLPTFINNDAKADKVAKKVNFVNSICQLLSLNGEINKILYLLIFIKLN